MSSLDTKQSPSQLLPFPDPIPGIIPFGTLTIVAGAPGVGKTSMLAEWIQRWRTGRTICEKPTNAPTGFYFLAADRQWKSHQLWFDAVGYPDIPHYSIADDPELSLAKLKSVQRVEEVILACLAKLNPIPGSHLVVDPVSPLFIAGNPNQARDVATSLMFFSRLAQKLLINITCTAHFGKQKSDPNEQYTRPQDRIAGSGAFSGFSDTQVYLIDPVPPKQPYHVLGWVPRHAAPEEFNFKRDEHSGLFVPYEHYTEENKQQAVLEQIAYEPMAAAAIIERVQQATGFPVRSIERYLNQLKGSGQITRVRKGVYQRAKPH
jgi:hypothetical protein